MHKAGLSDMVMPVDISWNYSNTSATGSHEAQMKVGSM